MSREHQYKQNQIIEEWLLGSQLDISSPRPDLILKLNPAEKGNSIKIAIEIERTLKSKKRLQQKLEHYMNRTLLDAVIYVCTEDEILNAIQQIYRSENLKKSLRVNHYKNLFLMFMDGQAIMQDEPVRLFNSDLKSVQLDHWLDLFQKIPLAGRRGLEMHFQPSAAEGFADARSFSETEIKNENKTLNCASSINGAPRVELTTHTPRSLVASGQLDSG